MGSWQGALAQLGERLICIQEVRSSILLGSTSYLVTLTTTYRAFPVRRSCSQDLWVGSSGG